MAETAEPRGGELGWAVFRIAAGATGSKTPGAAVSCFLAWVSCQKSKPFVTVAKWGGGGQKTLLGEK